MNTFTVSIRNSNSRYIPVNPPSPPVHASILPHERSVRTNRTTLWMAHPFLVGVAEPRLSPIGIGVR
jgi:hypothetical protein